MTKIKKVYNLKFFLIWILLTYLNTARYGYAIDCNSSAIRSNCCHCERSEAISCLRPPFISQKRLEDALSLANNGSIKKLGQDEIAISGPGLERIFVGDGKALTKRFNQGLEKPPKGPAEKIIRLGSLELTIFTRKNGPNTVWAIARDEEKLSQLAKELGTQLRTGEIEKLSDNEIAINGSELEKVFVGNNTHLTKKFNDKLGYTLEKPPEGPAEKIIRLGSLELTIFTRKNGPHTVWAIARDEEKLSQLAKELGTQLRTGEIEKLTDNEIAISGPGLEKVFAGDGLKLIGIFNDKIDHTLERPPEAPTEKTIQIGSIELDIFTRKSGSHTVWAIARDEEKLSQLAKELGTQLRTGEIKELSDNEIAISGPGLGRIFVGNREALTKRFNQGLEKPPKGPAEKIIRLGSLELTIFTRKNGHHTVWAIARDEEKLSQLAKELDTQLRTGEIEKLSDNEIAINGSELEKVFVGGDNSLTKKFNDKLGYTLEEPPAVPTEKTIQIGSIKLDIFTRKSGSHTVWAIARDEEKLSQLAKELDTQLRTGEIEKLSDNEIGINSPGLEKVFAGDGLKLIGIFNDKIDHTLERPPEAPTERTIQIGSIELNIFTRKSGSHTVWAIARDEEKLNQLADTLGTQLKAGEIEKLSDNEIAINGPGLERVFVGYKQDLINKFNQALGHALEKLPEVPIEKTIQISSIKLNIFTRKSGVRTVWAFDRTKVDMNELSKILQTTLRKDIDEYIEEIDLSEAIALLSEDPLRMQQYLTICHPELSEEEIDDIITHSLEGLKAEWPEAIILHLDYDEALQQPTAQSDTQETSAHAVVINGSTDPNISYVQVIGAYTRKIAVKHDGTFSATIPLPRIGEPNIFQVYAVNEDAKQKSPAVIISVKQTGVKEDTEEVFLKLLALKEQILTDIQTQPERYGFLLRSIEQSLLKHFTYNEGDGLRYLEEKIEQERSPALKLILKTIFKKFSAIHHMHVNIKPGQRLYFFQKYTIYEAEQLKKQSAKGIIICTEQGLGKTVTALALINSKSGVIIAPNSVVSTWTEQEEMFIPTPNIEALEGPYREREESLKSLTRPQIITNIEFTRGMTQERSGLLSSKAENLIVDEADYLGQSASQQSQGTRQIQAGFKLLLTATPFKRPAQIARLLNFIYPDDPRFKSGRAFTRAFPLYSTESLNALFLLLQQHTIRIRKQDVFDEYNPNIPLDEQRDRLPKKVEIPPDKTGQFFLSEEQCSSILELFDNYQEWCRKHKTSASAEDRQYYRFKEGYFSKREALRQIMNDPRYIGIDIESPKHLAMDKIVEKELSDNPEKKILIFTRYRAQVEEYVKRYERYGAMAYYGGLKADSNGYKLDDGGNLLYYQVDEYENIVLDDKKTPILSDKEHGRPIRALDYERILFQNSPDSRILVATYDTGAIGVTLTAADVVIFDDLAQTYRDQYQAGDRAHRIDNQRKKYAVSYYWLQALYPESFLEKLPPDVKSRYFGAGTYDQVHYENLRRQGRIFHRILDGVGKGEELGDLQQRFMRSRMPFLFANGESVDTEDTVSDSKEIPSDSTLVEQLPLETIRQSL